MLDLQITYDSTENIIFIKNNTSVFTNFLWFSITDCETNLNVTHWWMIIAPNETQKWMLPLPYYNIVKEFNVNVLDDRYNLLYKQNIKLKKIDEIINFKPKSLIDITYGSWESLVYRKECDIIFRNDDVIYDLGANVGVFSIWCSKQNVNHIYAFEPDNECIFNMRELFKDKQNVEIINKAILDVDKQSVFYLQEHSIANSLFKKSDKSIQVECINLEKFITTNNFKKPTILKCDIEGAEYDVIGSLSDKFFDSIRIFILEFHFLTEHCKLNLYKIIERFLKMRYSVRLTDMSQFENDVGTLIFEK
jgi:FkbM family methyltransferase